MSMNARAWVIEYYQQSSNPTWHADSWEQSALGGADAKTLPVALHLLAQATDRNQIPHRLRNIYDGRLLLGFT